MTVGNASKTQVWTISMSTLSSAQAPMGSGRLPSVACSRERRQYDYMYERELSRLARRTTVAAEFIDVCTALSGLLASTLGTSHVLSRTMPASRSMSTSKLAIFQRDDDSPL
ncbi:hypothetical protein [Halocatena salina]|uniref:Uncharacterized protein n=1 Tax=Halocatena salina TaxID=2934340 RepID=A0A8U0AA02_9EURY|nr:hypothetical protein [Halocatena salina]UPM44783.1 hypothetical protein MW046_15395 [Halocatena salina]